MDTFNHKNRHLFSGPHLIGLLLCIAGLFAVVSPLLFPKASGVVRAIIVGLAAIIIGMLILYTYSGTLIHFGEQKFKVYQAFGGYKFGEWTHLPIVKRVEMASSTYKTSNIPNGISPTFSGQITEYHVKVYTDSSKPFFCFKYSTQKKAIQQAKLLTNCLKAELVVKL